MQRSWYETIRKFRIDNNYAHKEVAAVLKIRTNVYQRYEYGQRLIPIDKLVMLADFYNTSTDYILGRTDDPSPPISRKAPNK